MTTALFRPLVGVPSKELLMPHVIPLIRCMPRTRTPFSVAHPFRTFAVTPNTEHVTTNDHKASSQISAPTFQEAIFRLQNYWSSKGCVVWLPHNTEV